MSTNTHSRTTDTHVRPDDVDEFGVGPIEARRGAARHGSPKQANQRPEGTAMIFDKATATFYNQPPGWAVQEATDELSYRMDDPSDVDVVALAWEIVARDEPEELPAHAL